MKNLKFKLDGNEMDLQDTKSLAIIVGKNGTGKSLMMKITWLANLIVNSFKEQQLSEDEKKMAITLLVRRALFDSETIELEVLANYDEGYVNFNYKNDKVTFLDYEIEKVICPLPIYLSSNTRLFNGLIQAGNPPKEFYETDLDIRIENLNIPIYDTLFALGFMERCKDKYFEYDEDRIKRFKDDYEIDIVAIKYDTIKKQFFFKDSTGKEGNCSRLSNGQQALIIMLSSAG